MGRPPNKVATEEVKLPVDPATLRMLDDLIEYGRIGTTRPDVVMFILRLWLWENQARLSREIASKDDPFSKAPTQSG